MALASQAMWELVSERAQLTDSDIRVKMEEIDLRDGSADGKMSGTLEACPTCGQKTNSVRKSCLYCGTEMPGGNAFAKT